MREILIQICPGVIWVIAGTEILIAVLLFLQGKRCRQPFSFWAGVLTLGLVFDAVMIALGAYLPKALFAPLSRLRFVAHGALIPLLFPLCGYALGLKKPAMRVLWGLTLLLMAAGISQALASVLEAREAFGVLRMASSDASPAWAQAISRLLSFGTIIPLMLCGVYVWIRRKIPCLFFSGLFMFVFSALGPATGNADLIFLISMFGELFMVLFLYLTGRRLSQQKSPEETKRPEGN